MSSVTERHDDIDAIISDLIAGECDARGITHADLARATGIPLSTVTRILDGGTSRVHEFAVIAHALGTTASAFMKRAESVRGGVR